MPTDDLFKAKCSLKQKAVQIQVIASIINKNCKTLLEGKGLHFLPYAINQAGLELSAICNDFEKVIRDLKKNKKS